MHRVRTGLLVIAGLLALALVAAGPATATDSNDDNIPDSWEKRHSLSLKVDQAKRDQDRDGLNNRGEFRSESDPRDDDSDDDGTEDGDENAGTIASFDGTTLTIDLLNGGSITGIVDEDTEVKCGEECNQDGEESERHPDSSGPGENSGPSDSSGPDDNSGPGGHHGDDGDGDEGEDCSVEDLAVGVTVHEAELELEDGDAVFEEIELARE